MLLISKIRFMLMCWIQVVILDKICITQRWGNFCRLRHHLHIYILYIFAYKAKRRERVAFHKEECNSEIHCVNIFCCMIKFLDENQRIKGSRKSLNYDVCKSLCECTGLSTPSSSQNMSYKSRISLFGEN